MMWPLMQALAMLLCLLVTPMGARHLAHVFLTGKAHNLMRAVLRSSWEAALPSVLDSFEPCALTPFSSLPHWSPLSFLALELESPLQCNFDGLLPDWPPLLVLPCESGFSCTSVIPFLHLLTGCHNNIQAFSVGIITPIVCDHNMV